MDRKRSPRLQRKHALDADDGKKDNAKTISFSQFLSIYPAVQGQLPLWPPKGSDGISVWNKRMRWSAVIRDGGASTRCV